MRVTVALPAQLHELTSLRFFAAFAVVHVHLPRGTMPEFMEQAVWNAGHLGVDLFFILSGFVLAHAYPHRPNQPLDYSTFLRNRFARVMPLHLFLCGVFVVIFAAGHPAGQGPSAQANWNALPAHVLAIHSLGTVSNHAWNFPSWSISAEMFTYTLFPLFMLIARKLPPWVYFGAASAVLAASFLILEAFGYRMTRMTYDFGVVRAILGFAVGVALQHVVVRMPNLGSIAPIGFTLTLGLVVVGIALRINDLWILLMFGPLIGFGAGLAASGTPTLLRHRWLVWLGERSFAVYMVHVLIILLTPAALAGMGLLGSNLATYAFTMVLIILAAHVLYETVECPARKWLRAKPSSAPAPARL